DVRKVEPFCLLLSQVENLVRSLRKTGKHFSSTSLNFSRRLKVCPVSMQTPRRFASGPALRLLGRG
ncbi:MAG: hypothetical protein ACUVSK_02840, partial [Desulfotomaculales bacterium]